MGLDSVELLLSVEKAFEIEISDKEANKIITVGEFYNTVVSKLAEKNSSMSKEEVWEKLRGMIARKGGLALDRVVPEARIVKDLGIN